MRHWRKVFYALSLMLFSSMLSAQTQEPVVSKQDDLSVQFLRIMFGDVVNILTGQPLNASSDDADADSVMGAVMEVWNGVLLIIATSFIVWQTFSWLLEAAHTGRGRSEQSIIWPIRIILALAAIVPLGLGYSGYQQTLFWASGQAIETANSMSDIVYDRLNAGESFAQAPSSDSDLRLATHLFESLVCLATVNNALSDIGQTQSGSRISPQSRGFGQTHCASNDPVSSCVTVAVDDNFRHYQLNLGSENGFANTQADVILDQSACGHFDMKLDIKAAVEGEEPLEALLADERFDNLLELHNELLPTAISLGNRYSSGDENIDVTLMRNRIREAALNYSSLNQITYRNYQDDRRNLVSNDALSFTDNFTPGELGWMALGATYWINSANFGQQQQLIDSLRINIEANWADDLYQLPDLRALWSLLSNISAGYGGLHTNQTVQASDINAQSENLLGDVVEVATSLFQQGGDPLNNLMLIGHNYLNQANQLDHTRGTISEVKEGLKSSVSGNSQQAIAFSVGKDSGQLEALESELFLIVMALYSVAMLYAYWLPALPLIHWLSACLSTILALAEVIVLAPLHAIAHIFRDGKGLVGQKAFQGYGIIIGALLRPPLLVIGFLIAYPLLIGGGYLANLLITPFFGTQSGATMIDILSFLGIGLVIGVIYSSIIERAFSVMHEITDRSIKIMGFVGTNFGGSQYVNAGQAQFQSVNQQLQRERNFAGTPS